MYTEMMNDISVSPVATDHLNTLTSFVEKLATGDLSQILPNPAPTDEFTSLYVNLQSLAVMMREKVTNLEKTNLELQENIAEKIALLHSINDGVVMLNAEKVITFINKSASNLTGWTTSELLNQKWSEIVSLALKDGQLVADSDPAQMTSENQAINIAGKPDYFYVRKDGTRFPVRITSTPISPHNQLQGTIIVFSDLTKEKAIGELKEDFLSLATHELRSPLTTMLWTLDMIIKNLHTQTPESLQPKLETVKRNGQNMNDLITDILTVTRLNDDALKENQKLTLLPELVQLLIDQVQPEAQQRKIAINFEITSPELSTLAYQVDPTLLSRCLKNLLVNAVRYSHPEGKVTITLTQKDKDICFTFIDHGIGIIEQDKPRIFEKFYRGDNIPSENLPGSGLGLFIVKAIVDRWQGNITLASQENVGTTVTVCLPLSVTN